MATLSGEATTVEHLRLVLKPGHQCSYTALIERLKRQNLPTAGVGGVVRRFYYKPGSGEEFTSWMRDRFWDEDHLGGWNEQALWIARRPDGG